ncbi:hypothetical protein LV779_16040 [Streptomyces thinghirensis]|nr:hypothetical protein [Streptomyces thinghirensis]
MTFEKLYLDQWLPELAEIWRAVKPDSPPANLTVEAPARQPADNAVAGQLAVLCKRPRLAGVRRHLPAQRRGRPLPLPGVRCGRREHLALCLLADGTVEPR